MDARNREVVQDLHKVLNMVKGFEAAYSDSEKGVMLVRHNGVTFRLEVDPVYTDNAIEKDMSFMDVVSKNEYMLR